MDVAEIKAALDERDAAISKKLEAVEKQNAELRDRLEDAEAKASSPGRTAVTAADTEHKKLFDSWLRRPNDSDTKEALANFEAHNRKTMNISTPSDGGYAAPTEWVREVERLEKKFSPVRNIVRVIPVSSNDVKLTVNIRGATSGWVGESGPRTATNTPKLRQVEPTFGELYAYPKVSEWALDDVFFPLGTFLAEEVAQEFALQEGVSFLTGNGSNQMTGMFNDPPTNRDDFDSPIRDWDEYQYVDADNDSPHTLGADGLVDVVYKLNSAYRSGASWIMNSATAGYIRKLKDPVTGMYLWQPALSLGQPDSLLGYPVNILEDMDDIATNGGGFTFPVGFGNWQRAYVICDRTQIRVTVDSNITEPGYVKYYLRRRQGGSPYNNDAAKFLRTSA